MKIGLVGATAKEVQPLLEMMDPAAVRMERAGLSVVESVLHGVEVASISGGVGKVFAAMATQLLIDGFGVTAVICYGTAGAIKQEVLIGDIVVGARTIQHDVSGAGDEASCSHGSITSSVFCADEELVHAAQVEADILKLEPVTEGRIPRIWNGLILTGDRVIIKESDAQRLRSKFEGLCVEMEGAAVGQVCTSNRIPFLVIRGISDRADGNTRVDFVSNAGTVSRNVARVVTGTIARISLRTFSGHAS